MTDLSIFKKNDRQILKKMSGNEGGRPVKKGSEKLSQKVTINFTISEKEKLLKRSKSMGGVPITTMIRNLLFENGYI
jgi:ribosomal protein L44E